MKTTLSLLQLSYIIKNISKILYLTIYYYKNYQYQHSIIYLNKTIIKIYTPYSFFIFTNIHHYIHTLNKLSLNNKYKKTIIHYIILKYKYSYINKLILKQKTNINIKNIFYNNKLKISPLIILLILLILNYHKLNNNTKSNYYIQTLKTLLFNNNKKYISHFPKNLS